MEDSKTILYPQVLEPLNYLAPLSVNNIFFQAQDEGNHLIAFLRLNL